MSLQAVPPLIPSPRPGIILTYRIWCGFLVAVYLAMMVYEIFTVRGMIEPDLGLITGALVRGNPALREQALADARESAFGGAVVSAFGAMFFVVSALVPRKPWGWTLGLVALIGSIFPFFVTAAGAIPFLISWCKPETKNYFSDPV